MAIINFSLRKGFDSSLLCLCPNGYLTSGNKIYCQSLSGTFQEGETIVDEAGNSLRIAKENTVSHFVVDSRGINYGGLTAAVIDGVKYDPAIIKPNLDPSNGIYKLSIEDRGGVSVEYAQPPSVAITTTSTTFSSSNAAVILSLVCCYSGDILVLCWCYGAGVLFLLCCYSGTVLVLSCCCSVSFY